MKRTQIYRILQDIVSKMQPRVKGLKELPAIDSDALLTDLGFDSVALSDLKDELEARLDGRDLSLESFFLPEEFNTLTFGNLVTYLDGKIGKKIEKPIVVYVDDEDENLFIFKRKFGRILTLETFNDPLAALEYILKTPDVALVITDEVMPGLRGNLLCDKVREVKPYLNFILITGNPESDEDLMLKSLRANRFYDFIRKPMDLEGKGDQYLRLIQELIA